MFHSVEEHHDSISVPLSELFISISYWNGRGFSKRKKEKQSQFKQLGISVGKRMKQSENQLISKQT